MLERRSEPGDRGLVQPHGARERVASHGRDRLRPADRDARLRTAEQLVAREQRHVRAGGNRLLHHRLRRHAVSPRVEQRSAAEIVDEQQPAFACQGAERRERGCLGETDDAEIRGVDAQDRGGAFGHGLREVADVRAVRRAHLDQLGAGLAHHVGDAEAAPDLDELTTRDDHFAARTERAEREQQSGRVVVDGDAVLGAGEAT